jgi:hypothetical protein
MSAHDPPLLAWRRATAPQYMALLLLKGVAPSLDTSPQKRGNAEDTERKQHDARWFRYGRCKEYL